MNNEKWNPVPPGFEPFWGIVSQSGKVIALRLASEAIAKQICDEHNLVRNRKPDCTCGSLPCTCPF